MKIKVCGMREAGNIRDVALLGPDFLGFIFYPQSKRYAGGIDEQLLAEISPEIKKTGVFVNASVNEIREKQRAFGLEAIQLHGDETPGLCEQIKNSDVQVIKAFGIDDSFDFNVLATYAGVVDHFLFDTKTAGYGGSGRTFNWRILDQYQLEIPYFLSGGLNPENINEILNVADDRLFAADLNSGFEIAPAIKNITDLKKAFNLLRP